VDVITVQSLKGVDGIQSELEITQSLRDGQRLPSVDFYADNIFTIAKGMLIINFYKNPEDMLNRRGMQTAVPNNKCLSQI
jgi:agmatine/peptidylarginine deiminase